MNDTHGSLSPKIAALFVSVRPVGSRVTCNPPPTDTDRDFLCLTLSSSMLAALEALHMSGYVQRGSQPTDERHPGTIDTDFISFRLGDTNLIVTKSPEFYRRFLAATAIAKRLNLLNKADRGALFQAVLYGNEPPT